MSDPTCAVCEGPVEEREDHAQVTVKRLRIHDPDGQAEFYLHDRCASAVFTGWREP